MRRLLGLSASVVSLFCLNARYAIADVPPWERPPDAQAPYVLPPWGLTVDDFVVTRQVPLSTGQREVVLSSPSTGSAQTLVVSLPEAEDYQLYEIGFERVLAAGDGVEFESPDMQRLLNNFQVEFDQNRLSGVVLADGSRAEFEAGRGTITSPTGEILETFTASEMNGGAIASSGKSSRRVNTAAKALPLSASNQLAQVPAQNACERDVYLKVTKISVSIEVWAGSFSQRSSDLSKAVGWALGHSSEALKNSLKLEDPMQLLTCRRPVQCEEQRLSGGSEIRTDLFDIPKGVNGSDVVLTYEFFQIPDSLEMFYDGNKIFSVGPTSGSDRKTFRLPASAQQVGITLRGNNDPDTRWWYVISCDPTDVSNLPTAPSLPE